MPDNFTDSPVRYKRLHFLGFPNYRVGTDGTVWRKFFGRRRRVWEEVKPRITSKRTGHLSVRISGKSMLVHRLVLLTFVGPCPDGMECRHFPDKNPANNFLSNLQWGTRKDNHQDRIIHGTNNYGETNGSAKTTEEVVLKIRKLWKTGEYEQKELAKKFGLTKANVWCIVHRVSWKYLD